MLPKSLRENLVFLAVSLVAFTTMPALAPAQPTYDPVNFTEPLKLSRGSLTPLSPGGYYLTHDETCTFVVEAFGWSEADCKTTENIIFEPYPDVDNLAVDKPNNEGYVEFDDWEDGAPKEAIDEIWASYAEGTRAQGERLGVEIEPTRWTVYPTLDQQKAFMYYGIELDWDGDLVHNITAVLFDRRGFVSFSLVPTREDLTQEETEAMVLAALNAYTPDPEQAYSNFTQGDKVAAAGALGVLATMMGVKYGKGFFATVMAAALVFLKKGWYLLLIPFVYLLKFFRKK